MVRLLSRQQSPVNGFQFVDAPISPEPMKTWDFEQLCNQVASRRALNPRFNLTTNMEAIRSEVDEQNAMRMLSIRGADSYIVNSGGGPAPNRLAPQGLRRVAGLVGGGVKRAASGAGVLKDWLGEGASPVPKEQANFRAALCIQCPKNATGDWTTFFTEPVAALVRQQLSMRKDLNLSTPEDAALNVCEACGCPLKLKVHVPIEHIKAHLSADVKKELDGNCWILSEIK